MKIYLFTADSCAACGLAKRRLESFGVKFEEVNRDDGRPDLIKRFKIRGVPTLIRDDGGDCWLKIDPSVEIEKLKFELKDAKIKIEE